VAYEREGIGMTARAPKGGFQAIREGDRLTVDRADSDVLVADDLLMDVASGRLDRVSVTGGVLRVHADNGVFAYRLAAHDPLGHFWAAHRIEEAT
jgi:hypothetical protein